MSTRLTALAAPLFGLLLVLTACGAPAPPSDSPTQPTAAESVTAEASVTPDPAPTSPTSVEVAGSTSVEVEPAGSTEPGTTGVGIGSAPDGALAAALDAILPGLGAAGDGPWREVCGQIYLGSERWLVETVAAGEYAPYVADGFIEPDDAARIVDLIEPSCG